MYDLWTPFLRYPNAGLDGVIPRRQKKRYTHWTDNDLVILTGHILHHAWLSVPCMIDFPTEIVAPQRFAARVCLGDLQLLRLTHCQRSSDEQDPDFHPGACGRIHHPTDSGAQTAIDYRRKFRREMEDAHLEAFSLG